MLLHHRVGFPDDVGELHHAYCCIKAQRNQTDAPQRPDQLTILHIQCGPAERLRVHHPDLLVYHLTFIRR